MLVIPFVVVIRSLQLVCMVVEVLLKSIKVSNALEDLRETLNEDDNRRRQQCDQGKGRESLGCK